MGENGSPALDGSAKLWSTAIEDVKLHSKSKSTDVSNGKQQIRTVNPVDLDKAKVIARMLAVDIVHYARDKNSKTSKRFARTMRRMVEKLLHKHVILFNGMLKKLELSRESGYWTFVNVMDEMLADSHFNWGRLVAMYAFTTRLVSHCTEQSQENTDDYCADVAAYLGDYVADHLSEWLADNGGWEAFEDYFAERKPMDDMMWQGFVILGLGALATMVAAR